MARISIPCTDREFGIFGADKLNKVYSNKTKIVANNYTLISMLKMLKIKGELDIEYVDRAITLLEANQKFCNNISDALR